MMSVFELTKDGADGMRAVGSADGKQQAAAAAVVRAPVVSS